MLSFYREDILPTVFVLVQLSAAAVLKVPTYLQSEFVNSWITSLDCVSWETCVRVSAIILKLCLRVRVSAVIFSVAFVVLTFNCYMILGL